MDWAVGEIMAALRSTGEDENTITFFTSDNGAPLANDIQGNLPLRGGKAQTWEGGWREPALVRWPGRIAPGTVTQIVASTMDIHPTIMSLAGLKPSTTLDGLDLSDALFGSTNGSVVGHECFFFYRAPVVANASDEIYAVRVSRP